MISKEQILAEICIIAEELGRAPGQKSFEKETGIGSSSWRGKYWARWGDAVEEAGFSANSWNAALDSSKVLDDYSEACRYFGRPPTYAELNLFGRDRDGFMGVNTFKRHFGSKNGIVAALRERALERGEQDLIDILPEVDFSPLEEKTAVPSQASQGWVYLLQSGNYYKIGRSDDLEKRVKQISIALPDKTELVHAVETDDPSGIEAYWHRRFAGKRKNGEWFELDREDVKAFRRRKFQ